MRIIGPPQLRVIAPLDTVTNQCHLDGMSNAAPQFDPEDDAEELAHLQAMIDEARAAEAAGDVVPHEVVREWLLALARGEDAPPPL